jgi:hypothetical protein
VGMKLSFRGLISLIFVLGTAWFEIGCTTAYVNPQLTLTDEADYFKVLDKHTERKQIYDGFYASIEFSSTMLNSSVMRYQLDENARVYQWNADQYANEKSKNETNLSKRSEFFLSFYTPERKNDDLNKPKTNWRIFLDAGGKRYQASIEKIKAQPIELMTLYPQHNRWSTPYRLIFAVPSSVIENGPSKLTITGPVGSASVDFKGIQ